MSGLIASIALIMFAAPALRRMADAAERIAAALETLLAAARGGRR